MRTLPRYVPSEAYFARMGVKGKLIRILSCIFPSDDWLD